MPRRPKRSTARQVVLEICGVVIGIGVALTLMAGVIGLQVHDTRASINSASTALEASATDQLVTDIANVRANVSALADYSKSPGWVFLQYAPRIGTPVRQATAVMNASAQVAQASADFDVLLVDLKASDAKQLVPVDTLARLAGSANILEQSLGELTQAVAALDPSAFPAAIQDRLTPLLSQANDLLPKIQRLADALPALARLFGSESSQRWFVAFQNGGEARGTGGLVGSYSIVDMVNGEVVPKKTGPNQELTAKANAELVPADTRQLWGAGRLAEVYGVNLSPNYPYAGELLASLWQRQAGAAPDAVLAMDQAVTVALVEAVGGLTVNGVKVTGDNALYWLTVGVYQKYPSVLEKDAFVTAMIQQLMQKLASGSIDQVDLAKALLPAVLEGRVLLWAQDDKTQAELAPSAVGGEVSSAPGPFAMAVVNNNAGNKMDTFMHTKVDYQGGECVPGGRRVKVSVELFNDPPAKLPSYVGSRNDRSILFGKSNLGDGSTRVRLAVYVPDGAYVSSAPGQLYAGKERGHAVSMFGVELNKGQRKTVTVDYTMFGEPNLLNQSPLVLAQPMLNPQQISIGRGPIC